MLLLTSQKALLVNFTAIFPKKMHLKTLFVKLEAAFSFSLFNFEYFYKKKTRQI
jgi:hypothetical protein